MLTCDFCDSFNVKKSITKLARWLISTSVLPLYVYVYNAINSGSDMQYSHPHLYSKPSPDGALLTILVDMEALLSIVLNITHSLYLNLEDVHNIRQRENMNLKK